MTNDSFVVAARVDKETSEALSKLLEMTKLRRSDYVRDVIKRDLRERGLITREANDVEKFSLAYYERLVGPQRCKTCGGPLGLIQCYPHPSGWPVEGSDEKLWLYKTCARCGYQWALWKLGVSISGEDESHE